MFWPLYVMMATEGASPNPDRIEQAELIAIAQQRPLVCWVGRQSPTGEAALPEAIHCHVKAIEQREGQGVMVGRYENGKIVDWRWFAGPSAPIAGLRAAAGLATPQLGACACGPGCICPAGSCPGYCPMFAPMGMMGCSFGGG